MKEKKENLEPIKITMNCDPRALLKVVFEHCVIEAKEKDIYSPELLATYLMYELASFFCPSAEELIYNLFCKEFGWKD